MPVTIRPATAEDAEAAGQICHDAFEDIAAAHSFPKNFPSPEVAAGLLRVLIAHPRFDSVVAEDGGRLQGHSVAESNPDLQALITNADEYFGAGFHVPTSNGALLTWCLRNGLHITKLMSLMTVGMYHTPRGAFLPSVSD